MIQIKNRYTQEFILEVKSLSNAYLSGANLRCADLSNTNLNNTNLSDVNLSGVDLSNADLSNAYLKGTYLSGVDLSGVNLSGANLSNAYLKGALNYYSFVAYDTSKRLVHCVKHKNTWMVKAGCFWGTLEELEIKVLDTHKSSVYLANIEILKTI